MDRHNIHQYLELLSYEGEFLVLDDDKNQVVAKFLRRPDAPTNPARRDTGTSGWALLDGKHARLHVCGQYPCRGRYPAASYSPYPEPVHGQFVKLLRQGAAPAVAERVSSAVAESAAEEAQPLEDAASDAQAAGGPASDTAAGAPPIVMDTSTVVECKAKQDDDAAGSLSGLQEADKPVSATSVPGKVASTVVESVAEPTSPPHSSLSGPDSVFEPPSPAGASDVPDNPATPFSHSAGTPSGDVSAVAPPPEPPTVLPKACSIDPPRVQRCTTHFRQRLYRRQRWQVKLWAICPRTAAVAAGRGPEAALVTTRTKTLCSSKRLRVLSC